MVADRKGIISAPPELVQLEDEFCRLAHSQGALGTTRSHGYMDALDANVAAAAAVGARRQVSLCFSLDALEVGVHGFANRLVGEPAPGLEQNAPSAERLKCREFVADE